MSKDMKLIMERWDKFIIEEEFEACVNTELSVDEFLTAIEIAIADPKIRKEKIDQLKSQQGTLDKANEIITYVGLISSIPTIGASSGLTLGAGVLSVFANTINTVQQKGTNKKMAVLAKLLCIDEQLLEIVEDDILKQYWTDSDLRSQLDTYIANARNNDADQPVPDFTRHFVKWLNDNSSYSRSDDTKVVVTP